METTSIRWFKPLGTALALLALAGGLVTPVGAAAKKPAKKKPVTAVAGKTCTPKGARAPGTNLDCVAVGKVLQWQPKGSRANPLDIGEAGEIQIYDTPPSRYRFTVLSAKPDATADVTLDPNKKPVPAGVRFVSVSAELTFLGDGASADPATVGYWEFVDSKDTAYGFYGGAECDQYGSIVSALSLRKAELNVPSTGVLCAAVPVGSINSTLLLRVRGLSGKAIWYRPIA